MPIFEYVCRDCHQQFETIVTASRPATCPTCQSELLDKQFSVFAVGGPRDTRVAAGPRPCGSCGDPRGAGSCRLD